MLSSYVSAGPLRGVHLWELQRARGEINTVPFRDSLPMMPSSCTAAQGESCVLLSPSRTIPGFSLALACWPEQRGWEHSRGNEEKNPQNPAFPRGRPGGGARTGGHWTSLQLPCFGARQKQLIAFPACVTSLALSRRD